MSALAWGALACIMVACLICIAQEELMNARHRRAQRSWDRHLDRVPGLGGTARAGRTGVRR